ncbi:hypothetical protein L9F63_009774 [Diploptera punctata]|uniref:AAA+ ATPase domain-containing protein n=1 Tax=Diploptera punctata TaxID=6984 RepID=A0AAD8AJ28_DIPPU|nr:hypothetical protein L9F63_009774 [Diploptera punctata]
MILYPLIYQDIYKRFNIKPSRGVLFHGPPGTDKTLIAKALHHECNRYNRKITFFSQKGAECLNMWVEDSVKKLRFLFAEAHLRRPSIIFFDEIDSLTPIRSERQDHVRTSVVSTLLALMDGLDTLTDVFVIGATNRIEAIDPALRRPGRFDCELYFPLPELNARKDIIHLYVDNWEKNSRPSNEFIEELATDMVGYSGADIKAFCNEAVKCSLRRKLPDVSTTENKKRACFKSFQVEICDFIAAKSKIAPLAHRTLHNPRKKIPHTIQPLLQHMIDRILEDVHKYNQQFLNRNKNSCGSHDLLSNSCLLLTGTSLQGQTNYIAPAILHSLQHLPVYMLDSTTLLENSTTEESCIHKFKQMYQNLPAILYTPHINSWWDIVGDATRIVFINEINKVKNNIFHLSTAHVQYTSLSPSYKSCSTSPNIKSLK